MIEEQDLIGLEFGIDDLILGYLKESAKWTKFIGITGFVFSAIFIMIGIGTFSSPSVAYAMEIYGTSVSTIVVVVYSALAILSFFFSMFLLRFGININTALNTSNQEKLTIGFSSLKSYFRTAGIVTILYIVFFLLAIIGSLVTSVRGF